jgi:hypothetical protein
MIRMGVPRVGWYLNPAHSANPMRSTGPDVDLMAPTLRNDAWRPLGHNNSEPKPEHWDKISEWAAHGVEGYMGHPERKPVMMWRKNGEEPDRYGEGGYSLGPV